MTQDKNSRTKQAGAKKGVAFALVLVSVPAIWLGWTIYEDVSRAHAVAALPSCKVEARRIEETIFCTANVCKGAQALPTFREQVKLTAQLCDTEARTMERGGGDAGGFFGLQRHYADELATWLRNGR